MQMRLGTQLALFARQINRGMCAALVTCLAMGGAGGAWAQTPPVMRIHNDPGGDLAARVALIGRLRDKGQIVEIRDGYCMSACTLYLGLDTTCVGRGARFGFHGPASRHYGVGVTPDVFEHWSHEMARHYPLPLRDWYLTTARHVVVGFYEITGGELIEMGVPECT